MEKKITDQGQESILKDYLSIKKFLNKISEPQSNYLLYNNNIRIINNQSNFADLKSKKNYLFQENNQLELCLNYLKDEFYKEIQEKINNVNKQDIQLKEGQDNLTNNKLLIKELETKLECYEKVLDELKNNKNKDNNNNYNLILLKEENKHLKEEIITINKLIEKIKKEINEKGDLLAEKNKVKNEIDNNKRIIENLKNEKNKKNDNINKLKDRNKKQNNDKTKNNENQAILKKLQENKEKNEKMKKELEEIK